MSLDDIFKAVQSNAKAIESNAKAIQLILVNNDANNRRNTYKNLTISEQRKYMLPFTLRRNLHHDQDPQTFCNTIHSFTEMECKEEEQKDDLCSIKYGSPIINKERKKLNYPPGLPKIPILKYKTKHTKVIKPQILSCVSENNNNNEIKGQDDSESDIMNKRSNMNELNPTIPTTTNSTSSDPYTQSVADIDSKMEFVDDQEHPQCITQFSPPTHNDPTTISEAAKENTNKTHVMSKQHNKFQINDNVIGSENNKNKIEINAKDNGNVNEEDDTCDVDNMNELSQRISNDNNYNKKDVMDSKVENKEEFAVDPSILTCLTEFGKSEPNINIEGIISFFKLNHINFEWLKNHRRDELGKRLKESSLSIKRSISNKIWKKLKLLITDDEDNNPFNINKSLDQVQNELEHQQDLVVQLQHEKEKNDRLQKMINGLRKDIAALKKKKKNDESKHESKLELQPNIDASIVSIDNEEVKMDSISNAELTNNTEENKSKSIDIKEGKIENLGRPEIPWGLMNKLMRRKYISDHFRTASHLRHYFRQITAEQETAKRFGDLSIFDTKILNNENKLMYTEIIKNKMRDLLSAEQLKDKYIQYSITRDKLPNGCNHMYSNNKPYDKSKIVIPKKVPKQIELIDMPFKKKNGNEKVVNMTETYIIDRIEKAKYSNMRCFPIINNGIKRMILPTLLINPSNGEYIYVFVIIDSNSHKIEGISGHSYQIEKCAKLCDVRFNIKPYENHGKIIRLRFKRCHGIIVNDNVLKAYNPSTRDYDILPYNSKHVKGSIAPNTPVYFEKDRRKQPIMAINVRDADCQGPLDGKIISCNVLGKHKWGKIQESKSGNIFVFSLCDVFFVRDQNKIQSGLRVTFSGIEHPNPFNKYGYKFMALNITINASTSDINAINKSPNAINISTSNMTQNFPYTQNINASINPSHPTQQLHNCTNLQEQTMLWDMCKQQQMNTNAINTPTSHVPMGNNGWMNNYITPNNNYNAYNSNIGYGYNYTNLQQQPTQYKQQQKNNVAKVSNNYNYNYNNNSNGYGMVNSNNQNEMVSRESFHEEIKEDIKRDNNNVKVNNENDLSADELGKIVKLKLEQATQSKLKKSNDTQ